MRMTYAFLLLLILGAIAIFALENREMMTLTFFGQSVTCPRSLMIAIVYVLGMLSGWIVVGLVQRLIRREVERITA